MPLPTTLKNRTIENMWRTATKSAANLPQTATDDLFTIPDWKVLMFSINGEWTTVANVTNPNEVSIEVVLTEDERENGIGFETVRFQKKDVRWFSDRKWRSMSQAKKRVERKRLLAEHDVQDFVV